MKRVILAITLLLLILGASSCTKTYTQPVFPGGQSHPDYQYWDGSFSFSGSRYLYRGSSFEIRWRGKTPPPEFEVRIRNIDPQIHIFSPYLKVYVKYADWTGYRHEYGWICFPRNWRSDNSYLVSIVVDGYEIRSEHFYYRG